MPHLGNMTDVSPEPTEPESTPESFQLAPPPAPASGPPVQPAPAAPARSSFARTLTAAIVAAVILAAGGGIGVGWTLARFITNHATATQSQAQTAPKVQQGGSSGNTNLDVNGVTRKVSPAVVDINTTIQSASGTTAAAGTGLIITSSGDVLTNNHVVEGSVRIRVTIQGKGTYSATVVGVDPSDDLAVIHVSGVSGLPTVTLGDSSSVKVGDTVYAMGNALGLGGAPRVTKGSITALDQSITASDNGAQAEQLTGMLQSDAEISPGDSGGALVNSAGQVIGIITAGEAQGFRSTSTTVAFAIPSSRAVDIANRILAGQAGNGIFIGPVGYLGVAVQDSGDGTGVQVRSVQAGSPAERAGISAGSVITGINSTTIDSVDSLGNALHQFKPGDEVQVTWLTGSARHTATVTLTSGPAI